MKIYTEVVYTWDDTKEELVKESSKSFDYHGPLALCWVQFIPAIIAGVQLAITVYGAYKGQQAAEEAAIELLGGDIVNFKGNFEAWSIHRGNIPLITTHSQKRHKNR